MDSSIKEHLNKILDEVNSLQQLVTQADEYSSLKDLELAVYEVRKTFERTRNINEEPPTIQEVETDSHPQ